MNFSDFFLTLPIGYTENLKREAYEVYERMTTINYCFPLLEILYSFR